MEDFPIKDVLIEFPEISKEIKAMADADQDMREKGINNPEYWDENIDKNNTNRMKQIIDEIGWPTISKVGKEPSSNAWLLVQHADHDVEFQKYCLSLMQAQPSHEIDSRDIARLTDRICVNTQKPQVYGAQFTQDSSGKFIPREIEDPENVDERRKEMGMDTLADNIELMYTKYKTQKLK